MSDIILHHSQPLLPSTAPSLPFAPALHLLMLSDLQAHAQGPFLYRSFLPRPTHPLQLLWRFQPLKNGNLRLNIRPNLGEGEAGNLRVDTQRGYVDLLRAISSCNRDKNRTLGFIVSEYKFVEVVTMFPSEAVKEAGCLRRFLKLTLRQLPAAIDRLLTAIQPFLGTHSNSHPQHCMGPTAKQFLEKSYKLLLLAKYNQLASPNPEHRAHPHFTHDQQAHLQLDQLKTEAAGKLKDCLKVMAVEAGCLKPAYSPNYLEYAQWIRSREDPRAPSQEKERNVIFIKVESESRKTVVNDDLGAHCRILLSSCSLTLLLSATPEVNEGARQMRSKEGQAVVSETRKEVEVVRKELRNRERMESRNSLRNELDFIYYIKERACSDLSVYYLESGKKKEEAEYVLMDYYPHNLRQMLASQGALLSARHRLSLLTRITAALNWLAGNHICHRDLKPENIMLTQRRLPKLIDFGSCCPVNGNSTHFQVTETRLLGTPNYYRPFPDALEYAYRRNEYEQHLLFDAYSLGRVMRDVFLEGLPRVLPNLEGLMEYMMMRCEEEDPADRLTYQELLFLLEKIEEYLEWLEGGR